MLFEKECERKEKQDVYFWKNKPCRMYEELLNFLLARKKRLLSEEETDRLMDLIAKSMGFDEDFRERTDSKALIKKILDNVDVEEVDADADESDSVREAVDDLFFDDASSDSSGMMYAPSDSGDGKDVMLSEKKFKRGEFKGTRGEGVGSIEKKKIVGIKQRNEANDKEKMVSEEAIEDAGDVKREFKLPGFEVGKEAHEKSIDASMNSRDDFWFDIGDLKKVGKAGPDVKFFDEEGKEL